MGKSLILNCGILFSFCLLTFGCGGGGGGGGNAGNERRLVAVQITPATPSVQKDSTFQLEANAVYNDGTSKDVTSTVEWTSKDETVATVDAAGLASGLSPGTVKILAAIGSKTGSTELIVLPDPLPDLVVSIDGVSSTGSTIAINYTVRNDGTVATDGTTSFYVDVWENAASSPVVGSFGEGFERITPPVLAAGGGTYSGVISYSSTVTSGTAYAIVDTTEALAEAYESNNVSSSLTWGPVGVDMEIAIDNVTLSGSTLTVSYTVINLGSIDTDGVTAFYIDFFADASSAPTLGDFGDAFVLITPPSISAWGGAYSSEHAFNTGLTAGTAYAIVDSSTNLIGEANEANNVSGGFSWDSESAVTTYYLETFPNASPGDADTVIDVYHSSDLINPVKSNDDGGGGGWFYSSLTASLISGETYYLKVYGYASSSSGSYSLRMSRLGYGGSSPRAPSNPDTNESNNNSTDATPFTLDTVLDNTLTSGGGDVDWFVITLP